MKLINPQFHPLKIIFDYFFESRHQIYFFGTKSFRFNWWICHGFLGIPCILIDIFQAFSPSCLFGLFSPLCEGVHVLLVFANFKGKSSNSFKLLLKIYIYLNPFVILFFISLANQHYFIHMNDLFFILLFESISRFNPFFQLNSLKLH